MDELFSLGTREDVGDEAFTLVGTKRKFGSEPRMGEATKPAKKQRTTELPSTTSTGFNLLQNVEVRLEKNVSLGNDESSAQEESQASSETEGRSSRRARSKVSYKEPALGKKLRQVYLFFSC